jgi:hypothetical protein
LAAVFLAWAMHFVKSGGSGTAAFGWPLDLATTVIQCSKSCFSMVVPSTSATALPGTPPHPARMAAGTKKAPSARAVSFLFMIAVEGSVGVISAG